MVARALIRAARAAADLSKAAAPTESTVAAEVLNLQELTSPPESLASPSQATDRPARDEEQRIDRLRRWAGLGGAVRGSSPVWAWPRRGPGTARLVAIVEVRRTAAGAPRSCHVVPLDVTLRTAPVGRRDWRSLCRRVAADDRVHQAAIEASRALEPSDPWIGTRVRLGVIRAARRASLPRSVQPSLFDRRALRDARGFESVALEWDTWQTNLERRLAASAAPMVTTRVVALFPLEGMRQ